MDVHSYLCIKGTKFRIVARERQLPVEVDEVDEMLLTPVKSVTFELHHVFLTGNHVSSHIIRFVLTSGHTFSLLDNILTCAIFVRGSLGFTVIFSKRRRRRSLEILYKLSNTTAREPAQVTCIK